MWQIDEVIIYHVITHGVAQWDGKCNMYCCGRTVTYVTTSKCYAQCRLSTCRKNCSWLIRRPAKTTRRFVDRGGAVPRQQKTSAVAGSCSADCGTWYAQAAGTPRATHHRTGSVARSVLLWHTSETRMFPWVCTSASSWTNSRRSETSAKPSRICDLNLSLITFNATTTTSLSIRPSIR